MHKCFVVYISYLALTNTISGARFLFGFLVPTCSLEVFDHVEFNKWVEMTMAPAIQPNLRLFEEVTNLGFKIFLLTAWREQHRSATVNNLIIA